MSKKCDVCGKELPEDYVNALCDLHYKEQVEEIARVAKMAEEEKAEHAKFEGPETVGSEGYTENPQKDDKPQWMANIKQFDKSDMMLWYATRYMYEFIRVYSREKAAKHPQWPKYRWFPDIVDVGCGSGVGSNVMSQDANFVWGIDKNAKSIKFAKECFNRDKNKIYYSSQVSFDEIDIIEDKREFMTFDLVVAIEIIEHIDDYKTFLKKVIELGHKEGGGIYPTEWFISTPNRNHKSITKDHPNNAYHVREWRSEEFYEALSPYFKSIEFLTAKGVPIEGYSTNHTPILARCSNLK